ncbi:MAG: SDR family NAD(P)-dependent oxidoreductase [Pseudorhizobium sp.]
MTQFTLNGKNAAIIGGSSGIGLSLAHGLQQAGAHVVIISRTASKVEAAVADLKKEGGAAIGYSADVRDVPNLNELSSRIEAECGPVDILINCQGVTALKPALEFTETDYDTIMDTNLRSVFFSCLAFGRQMVERKAGCVINIASLAAHRGWPLALPYSISKHGVVGLTKTLAAEWAEHGVRVNAISPGFFITELNRDKMAPERKSRALSRTPAGRFGAVEELIGAAVYLSAPASGFVTGAILNVDGGYLASGI